MRLNEVSAAISAAGSKYSCWGRKPVVYVEIKDGVFCEVTGVRHYPHNNRSEVGQIVIQISDPVEIGSQ